MRPNPSEQPSSKRAKRPRRSPAKRLSPEKRAAAKVPPAVPSPAMPTELLASGSAYFTFTSNGELMITSYELAEALRTAGGATFVKSKGIKKRKGIQVGIPGARLTLARSSGGPKTLDDDPPQVDSMCMCDAEC